ncbi:outer membrane lipoprotein carrier protein LolA [Plantactinospora siamensis]|uniref:Outer membrane lipoprotein carrier protein LolA n=1 Tax=Plantactinospora siamensis TaxID=555372 RepID=A0ABV6NS16_9ACTN
MSMFSNRPALRWIVPAAATAVVLGGGAAIGTFAASADPALPPRTAAQLLVDLQTARLDGLSGTVVQRADLGLPSLPNLGAGQGEADLATLASGTHTLRVWYAGEERQRVALLGTLGETDMIHNGADVWVWASQRNEAVHRTLSEADRADHESLATGLPSTPQQAAEQALAAVDPTTEVTVGRTARIAGRDAYELVLGPRDKSSLVGQVRVAIDAKQHVPLRLRVFAKSAQQPVFEVAFTQVDFTRPDAQQFVFNPPAGTKVVTKNAAPEAGAAGKPDARAEAAASRARTVGKGWTTVLVARMDGGAKPAAGKDAAGKDAAGKDRAGKDGAGTPGADAGNQLGALLNGLPKVSGDWGSGRLFTSKLVTALLTDDGRVLVGAVTPDRLYEVARTGR